MTHAEVAAQSLAVAVGRGDEFLGRATTQGPVSNLLLGLTAIAIYMFAVKSHFLLLSGSVILVFGAMTLLIPADAGLY